MSVEESAAEERGQVQAAIAAHAYAEQFRGNRALAVGAFLAGVSYAVAEAGRLRELDAAAQRLADERKANAEPALIYTDAYGTVTQEQFDLYRRANVTTYEHEALVDKFGHREHQVIIDFVTEQIRDGSYYEPFGLL